MRVSALQWTLAGIIGLSFLAVLTGTRAGPRAGAAADTGYAAWLIHQPGLRPSPYRTVMRAAGFWRAQAAQLADEEAEAARAALQGWDPAASFDSEGESQRALAADSRGYLSRALGLLDDAERVASTPEEKARAHYRRERWEAAARPIASRPT